MIREGLAGLGRPRLLVDVSRFSIDSRIQAVLAYAAMAIAGLAVAFVQPVWQLTDEAQHTDVLAQYAHGVYPVEGTTTLRPETVAVMVATGNYRWSPPETQPAPAVVDPTAFAPPPTYLSGYNFRLWVRRHIWWFSYEAMQPPLFYTLATPVWMVGERLWGVFGAVYAVRALNALLLALLAPLALATARLLAPRRTAVQLGAVALTATLPGLLLNGSQVTNDTLGAVLGCATCVQAVRLARDGWTGRGAVLLGALFGLTLTAKLTDAGLVIGLVAAWLWPLLRLNAPRARHFALGALAGAAALLPVLPWLALNMKVYGHPVPTSEAARLLGAGTSAGSYTVFQSALYAWQTFWTGEHLDTLPFTGAFAAGMLALAGLGLVGVVRMLRGTARAATPRASVWVLAALAGGQVLWAMAIPATSGLGGMTPGRYMYPVVAPVMALLAAGAWAVVRSRALQAALLAAFVAGSTANFVAYGLGYTAVHHEWRSGPPTNLAVTDVELSGAYSGVGIDVDRAVLDPRAGSVWIHVHVLNSTGAPADWWPGPAVRASNGVHQSADYAASTPFPETLAPGVDYWGWLRLGVPPEKLPAHGTLQLVFQDVATDGYREVGTIPITMRLG